MAFLRLALILLLTFAVLGACGRTKRFPSPPVPSCYFLTYQQREELLRLFWNSAPWNLGVEVLLDSCQEQCGVVLYTGERDPEEVRKQVPAEVKGWPVCAKAGRPTFIGQALPARKADPLVNP